MCEYSSKYCGAFMVSKCSVLKKIHCYSLILTLILLSSHLWIRFTTRCINIRTNLFGESDLPFLTCSKHNTVISTTFHVKCSLQPPPVVNLLLWSACMDVNCRKKSRPNCIVFSLVARLRLFSKLLPMHTG